MGNVTEPLKLAKREAILQAALELVAEKGLPNTFMSQISSMSQISRQARASAGVIYHYFESKDELLQTLYLRIKAYMGKA